MPRNLQSSQSWPDRRTTCLRKKHNFNWTNFSTSIPCWILNTPPVKMHPLRSSCSAVSGHFTLELVHLSSCTTQGQIQVENDYAIDKVSTTITTTATYLWSDQPIAPLLSVNTLTTSLLYYLGYSNQAQLSDY